MVEEAKMANNSIMNLGESKFVGLINNICRLRTKISMENGKREALKALLVMIEQMPTQQKKHSVSGGSRAVGESADQIFCGNFFLSLNITFYVFFSVRSRCAYKSKRSTVAIHCML
jgi:hypothetical protein